MKLINGKEMPSLTAVNFDVPLFSYKLYEQDLIKFLKTKGRRAMKKLRFPVHSVKTILAEVAKNCKQVEEIHIAFELPRAGEAYTYNDLEAVAKLPGLKKLVGLWATEFRRPTKARREQLEHHFKRLAIQKKYFNPDLVVEF